MTFYDCTYRNLYMNDWQDMCSNQSHTCKEKRALQHFLLEMNACNTCQERQNLLRFLNVPPGGTRGGMLRNTSVRAA